MNRNNGQRKNWVLSDGQLKSEKCYVSWRLTSQTTWPHFTLTVSFFNAVLAIAKTAIAKTAFQCYASNFWEVNQKTSVKTVMKGTVKPQNQWLLLHHNIHVVCVFLRTCDTFHGQLNITSKGNSNIIKNCRPLNVVI